jgi:Flp pilus assembly protein TadB
MADVASGRSGQSVTDQSTSELVQRAGEQVSRLVRDELALAKAELAEKGKHAGIGVGLFGGAGGIGFYAVGTLIATLVLVLDIWLPAWAAALIVTGALLLIAGILALLGRRQVQRAKPPMPESAAQSVRADVETVKAAVRGRGAGNG